MEAFTVHVGRGVPLRRSDVDTDQIIPSDYLKRVTRTGFEDGLFAGWRAEGGFIVDEPQYVGASVLVAGPNFGTGSSREHAVWALQDFGFKAVISSRFADIFAGNAPKNGLLPVTLPLATVEALQDLVEADPTTEITVDLEAQEVRAGGLVEPFNVDADTRWRLLNGFDDIGVTLRHADEIEKFELDRPSWLPITSPV
jgi:3-isopropylmalate/(R)-2-methylmalate dehydratase small subunit